MAYNSKEVSVLVDGQIDMADAWQVLGWCRHFSLTKSQLEAVVKAVGNSVSDIESYLGNHPSGKLILLPANPETHRQNQLHL